jgi:5-methylcytosine-specific restriction endonuclease McrA
MAKCIVLNSDMSILGTTDYKRAIRLVVTGKAESLVDTNRQIHPEMFVPAVIRLVKAIRNLWRKRVPWSKQNVHVRDKFICQYCGTKIPKNKATIDHVIPQAQGGKNSWENCVCSCFRCNNYKEDRTPSEANMSLKKKPVAPTIMEFLYKKIKADGLEEVLKELGVY